MLLATDVSTHFLAVRELTERPIDYVAYKGAVKKIFRGTPRESSVGDPLGRRRAGGAAREGSWQRSLPAPRILPNPGILRAEMHEAAAG